MAVDSPFPTTRWSVVLAAGGRSTAESAEAFAALCEQYWNPIYGFLRRQGLGAHDAEDLTQGFLARLFERRGLGGFQPDLGRFRSYLLGALRHYVSDERDRDRAAKRGGEARRLQGEAAERALAAIPSRETEPEAVYDRLWGNVLVDSAKARLRADYERTGSAEIFEALHGLLAGDRPETSYAHLGKRLGKTEGAIKVAVHRLRARFREALRAEVLQTVSDPSLVDDELRHLLVALRS